jgi:CARDB
MRERIVVAGLVLAGVLAAAAPASAAGKADMEVARTKSLSATVTGCDAAGCSVRLLASAHVANTGSRRASRTRVGFFLSRDASRDAADIPVGRLRVKAIAGGRRSVAVETFSLSGIPPAGYRVIACADITRRVRERREGNNCRASSPFLVQAPAPESQPQPQTAGPCQETGWRTELCALIDEGMRTGAWEDMADVLSFALLFQHHRTGQPIPSSIAAGVIEPYRTGWDPIQGRAGLRTFRTSGFLAFWVIGPYDTMEWERYPQGLDTVEEFANWWQTYAQVQWTTRQNAINHSLNGIVQSELAWRNAMDDWKAWDLKLVTAQQYSDATVFAHRTLEDAQTAVMRAENAIKP